MWDHKTSMGLIPWIIVDLAQKYLAIILGIVG
jgi:hypothetical protein